MRKETALSANFGIIIAMFFNVKYFALSLLFLVVSCHAADISKTQLMNRYGDTTIKIGGVEIIIKTPPKGVKISGTILLLPGWNYSNTKWCDSSNLCSEALARGYNIVAPQMGKSIYASEYFPETRSDYKQYPTLVWLDTILEKLKKEKGLFLTSGLQRNFVVGLSTGARGAALICARKPGFFHAAALLSGDYDQCANTEDALCTNVYGPYNKFANRWRTVDNPMNQISRITTPMYIGHGGMDKVVHVSQSINYYDSLLAKQKNVLIGLNSKYVVQKLRITESGNDNPELSGHLNAPGTGFVLKPEDYLELNIIAPAGHDFAYWRSELPAIWNFFDKR